MARKPEEKFSGPNKLRFFSLGGCSLEFNRLQLSSKKEVAIACLFLRAGSKRDIWRSFEEADVSFKCVPDTYLEKTVFDRKKRIIAGDPFTTKKGVRVVPTKIIKAYAHDSWGNNYLEMKVVGKKVYLYSRVVVSYDNKRKVSFLKFIEAKKQKRSEIRGGFLFSEYFRQKKRGNAFIFLLLFKSAV